MKCGCSIYFFLNSANLICRDTDISKFYSEAIGLRDNECLLSYNNKTYLITHLKAREEFPNTTQSLSVCWISFLLKLYLVLKHAFKLISQINSYNHILEMTQNTLCKLFNCTISFLVSNISCTTIIFKTPFLENVLLIPTK